MFQLNSKIKERLRNPKTEVIKAIKDIRIQVTNRHRKPANTWNESSIRIFIRTDSNSMNLKL